MPLDKMPGSEQLVAGDAMTSVKWIAIGVCCLWAAGAANSSQTVAYTYDALGRLKQAQVQSGPEAGTLQVFTLDPAGNRINYPVSGATTPASITASMTSTVINQTVMGTPLTVNFSGTAVGGTVSFYENGVFLGSTWVANGQASIILEDFPRGTHTITVNYSGDGTHAAQTTTFTIRVASLSWLPAVLELLLN